ncbi:MAG: ABC transporter ATP-binding protein [Actinobacteria bacterium]|nr:ABC transporter ATP-binding protein [Actinomycetota bacterium]
MKDVSFEVSPQETFGLIGHNGAGKSTLLKLMNGLIRPDTGSIMVRGRVGALIELGLGFNPVLTGRENIQVNAAVLGFKKSDIKRKMQQIIDFAEIGDFIDAPVQSFSSGMKVRLGFAIAAHLDPDVLLVDEILSVGDSSFRDRCVSRLNNFKEEGGTIVFVSHNSLAVEAICDRVLLLDHGQVVEVGDPSAVVERYETDSRQKSFIAGQSLRLSPQPSSDESVIEIVSCELQDSEAQLRNEFNIGETIEIRLSYHAREEIKRPYFDVALYRDNWPADPISYMSTLEEGFEIESVLGSGSFSCLIHKPNLAPGPYHLSAGVRRTTTTQLGSKWYAPLRPVAKFNVSSSDLRNRMKGRRAASLTRAAPLLLDHRWSWNDRVMAVGDYVPEHDH